MDTIKNTFKKFPLISLIVTHFVVVWLVPLFLLAGFNFKALWFAALNFWISIPYLFEIYSEFFKTVVSIKLDIMQVDLPLFYLIIFSPLLVFFTIWIKKKITGMLTVRDIIFLVILCSIVPVMYVASYIYIYTSLQIGGF